MNLIIFDFDGVIVDSLELSAGLNRLVNPSITNEQYVGFFSGNIYDAIEQDETKFLPEDIFFEKYGQGILDQRIFDGMKEVVTELAESFTLAIVSSTNSASIRKFLIEHGLNDYFEHVLGADVHRSKVHKINWLLEQYGILPSQAVMVTDTVGDIKEAAQVGVKAIAVDWGYQTAEVLTTANPHALVNKAEHIIEHAFKVFETNEI